MPHATIGFFLHIPFPSFEIFRLLHKPWKEKIVGGMLGADLIGFHTFGYLRHFRSAVLRLLGVESEVTRIRHHGHTAHLGVYPIGINAPRFADADPWLRGAEGVIAKELDAPYRPGERTGMVKIKRVRTIDAVVMGWRPGKEEGTVGSFILGLHDENGKLRPVGHTSGFSAKEKRELPAKLAPYETGKRGMGDPSRWANDRELEWIELRPELVVEVTFDHTSNNRIRHGAKITRWREDKPPAECLTDQLTQ